MLNKSRLYPILLILVVFIVWMIRQKGEKLEKVQFNGETMGTYYNITYLHSEGTNYKSDIDELLVEWNNSLSTYIPDSEISQFNRNTSFKFVLPYFYPVLARSKEIFRATGGAFDPTIMPLVNAWGFGPEENELPDSSRIKELKKLVDFDKIVFDTLEVKKMIPGISLDFSAIAKGYGVDVVGDFLSQKGVENYLVDIGGEIICKGKNDRGTSWTTGIEDPGTNMFDRKLKAIIALTDKGIATSGNYRNFYVKDGKKYAHTISPFTGFPVEHSLLSATVIADDCMTADAFATAFMVLGLDDAKSVIEDHPELDVYFIFSDNNGNIQTFMTEGFRSVLKTEY
jgi:thiamine biosynthesis lipoprotein